MNMDADFIEDIVDLIPGSILSKEEEEQIEQFLDLIEDISSGEFPLKMIFTEEKE